MNTIGAEVVVDLGCGVGSSLSWLSERSPARYYGITLSPLQARLASQLFREKTVRIRSGSYLDPDSYDDLSDETGRFIFFGIESWLHCSDPAGLFGILEERTKTGDVLVLWDDFLSRKAEDKGTKRILDDFRRGWHAHNVLTTEEADEIAGSAGFDLLEDQNLTSHLEIDRFRDRLIAMVVPVLKPLGLKSAWWQNLLGGNALRKSLKSGLLNYRFRAWIRR